MLATKRVFSLSAFLGLLLFAAPAWAGDCSDPSDCSSIPDNGTKAACIGGVIAGYCLYERTKRKKKEGDPAIGEEADDQTILFGSNDTDPADSTDTAPTRKPPGGDILNQPLGGDEPGSKTSGTERP